MGERGRMGGRGYGAQRERGRWDPGRDISNKFIENDNEEQDKSVDDYFATLDISMKENVKTAEKVTRDILNILPQLEKININCSSETDEDFSSIAANIIVNFQL